MRSFRGLMVETQPNLSMEGEAPRQPLAFSAILSGTRRHRPGCLFRNGLRTGAFVYDVQWIELIVIVLIEPAANEVEQSQAGSARQRQRIGHELRDGLLGFRAGLVINNVNCAVSDL